MNEHIFTLETTTNYLYRAKSLAALMAEYFCETDPEPQLLLCRYEEYGELNHAIHDILCKSVKVLNKLAETYWEEWRIRPEWRTQSE